MSLRPVVIESPYDGNIRRHIAYARDAIAHSLARGEAPIASHLLYTQPGILNDDVPAQRELGIGAGHAWIEKADAVIVYDDFGVTPGMQKGIRRAVESDIQVTYRSLPGWQIGGKNRDPANAFLDALFLIGTDRSNEAEILLASLDIPELSRARETLEAMKSTIEAMQTCRLQEMITAGCREFVDALTETVTQPLRRGHEEPWSVRAAVMAAVEDAAEEIRSKL